LESALIRFVLAFDEIVNSLLYFLNVLILKEVHYRLRSSKILVHQVGGDKSEVLRHQIYLVEHSVFLEVFRLYFDQDRRKNSGNEISWMHRGDTEAVSRERALSSTKDPNLVHEMTRLGEEVAQCLRSITFGFDYLLLG
jgi:hypothetical protein